MPGLCDLPDELILIILREVIGTECTENPGRVQDVSLSELFMPTELGSYMIYDLITPLACDAHLLTLAYQAAFEESRFRLVDTRQQQFLEKFRAFSAPPPVLRNIRHLVLDVAHQLQRPVLDHGRHTGGTVLGNTHGQFLRQITDLFPALESLEIDVESTFLRHPSQTFEGRLPYHLSPERHLMFNNTNIFLFYGSLIHVLMRETIGDHADVSVRIYNETDWPNILTWRRAGTMRPAIRIASSDFNTFSGLVTEMMFLPHVVAVLRRDEVLALLLAE